MALHRGLNRVDEANGQQAGGGNAIETGYLLGYRISPARRRPRQLVTVDAKPAEAAEVYLLPP